MNFRMYRPVRPHQVLQPFGTNGDYYRKNGINILGHNGLDLLATHGEPIYAAHDGMAYYEIDDKQGQGVVLRTNDTYDYGGQKVHMKTVYWHMCDPNKEPKFASPVWQYQKTHNGAPMPVTVGDLIGYADTTGLSTGDHLHFALKPQAWNENDWTWYNTEQNNGYLGAIDPTPFLADTYAQDVPAKLSAIRQTLAALLQSFATYLKGRQT